MSTVAAALYGDTSLIEVVCVALGTPFLAETLFADPEGLMTGERDEEGTYQLPSQLLPLAHIYRATREAWRNAHGIENLRLHDRAEALETILADCLRRMYGISIHRNITIPTPETFRVGYHLGGV